MEQSEFERVRVCVCGETKKWEEQETFSKGKTVPFGNKPTLISITPLSEEDIIC